MKGHVTSYQIKAGKRWRIVYDGPPDPQTGKRRQRQKRGFTRERDAQRELRELLGSVDVEPTSRRRRRPSLSTFADGSTASG